MATKVERYTKRASRHLKKYPDAKDWFTKSNVNKWTVKDLMWWLDWEVIPVCSMSADEITQLQAALAQLLQKHYNGKQLELFIP